MHLGRGFNATSGTPAGMSEKREQLSIGGTTACGAQVPLYIL